MKHDSPPNLPNIAGMERRQHMLNGLGRMKRRTKDPPSHLPNIAGREHRYWMKEERQKFPEPTHRSLNLDSGRSADFWSALVRLLSNESNSPTNLSEGKVRLSKSPG